MRLNLFTKLVKRYIVVFAAACGMLVYIHNVVGGLQQKELSNEMVAKQEISKEKLAEDHLAVRGGEDGGINNDDNNRDDRVVGREKALVEQEAVVHMAREPQAPVERKIIRRKDVNSDSDVDQPAATTLKPVLPVLRYDDPADVDEIYGRMRDGKEVEPFPASGKFPTQLKLMERMGGRIVVKKPLEEYEGVVYPKHIEDHEPHGYGEGGKGANIGKKDLNKTEKIRYDEMWEANSFNEYLSENYISVKRGLEDCRSDICKEAAESYPSDLPPVDVVIIFHNEAWSILLRTVHAILSRTPDHLLGEIILVDDLSTNAYIGAPLEKYMSQLPKVKIVRATVRVGLTKARLLGYWASTAPVLVFLDAHVECFPGWAEPLLAPIKANHSTVVFPNIERISPNILGVGCNHYVSWNGIFRMNDMTFQWGQVSWDIRMKRKKDQRAFADNIPSPTMPGGLFAISRVFFERVGTYDPELEHWGGENIELSFKTWMCYGTLLLVPCSHIGHIFRAKNPIKWDGPPLGNKNSVRVAEVWMDDYKNYFYERNDFKQSPPGDISYRIALREKLQCHDFAWYHKNVYPGMLDGQIVINVGEIKLKDTPLCIDSMGGVERGHRAPELYGCHHMGGSQFWILTSANEILSNGNVKLCGVGKGPITGKSCMSGAEQWKYNDDGSIFHIPYKKCLQAQPKTHNILLEDCIPGDVSQQWTFQERRTDINFPT